ncbi:phosphatidate cytidylyltransferase [bacterium]|nr:phosphatidate cytidylyltransferase [bacterium]
MAARLPVFFGGIFLGVGATVLGGWLFTGVLAIVSGLLLLEMISVFTRAEPAPGAFVPASALIYVCAGVSAFYLLRSAGRFWPLCAILVAVTADTAAYLVGRRWGKTPLAPKVSPAKTWEGALAGVVCSAVAVALAATGKSMPAFPAALLGAGLAVLAVLGDLFESFLKRRAGVKDFGSSLPGHGGLFDRVDSLLAVSIGLFIFTRGQAAGAW